MTWCQRVIQSTAVLVLMLSCFSSHAAETEAQVCVQCEDVNPMGNTDQQVDAVRKAMKTLRSQYGDATCSEHQAKADTARSRGVSLDAFDWSQLQGKVLLLGDEHTYTNPSDLFDIINQSPQAKSAGACLFLEMPSSMSLQEFEALVAKDYPNPEQMRYIRYYREILNRGKQFGMGVHLVDHPDHLKNDKTINERDQAIAGNIKKLLDNGSCKTGVMVVGKAHIAPDAPNRTLIRDHLRSAGVTSSSFQIIYSDRAPSMPGLGSWNTLCPVERYTPSQTIVFSSSDMRQYSIYPKYTPLLKFSYFDYTSLVPR